MKTQSQDSQASTMSEIPDGMKVLFDRVKDLADRLETESPMDQAGTAAEISQTMDSAPTEAYAKQVTLDANKVAAERGFVTDWTHEDIKKIPGWQSMTPQQLADKLRASRMKWWEKPPEQKSELKPEIQQVMQEREKVYGAPHLSHTNIGLAWTALLQQHYQIQLDHPIPHWLAELMLASYKVQRSACVYHADNYLDVRAYLEFAEHGQSKPNEPFVKHKPLKSDV